MRARFYNPVLGRFTQEDTYRDDGLNLYAYCGNNPVRYYDPSGFESASKTRQFSSENTDPFVMDLQLFGNKRPINKLSDDYLLGKTRKETKMLINEYDNVKLGNGTPRIYPDTEQQTVFQANELKQQGGSSRNGLDGSLEWGVPGSDNQLRILQRPDGKFGYVTKHDYSKPKLFPSPWFPDGGKN